MAEELTGRIASVLAKTNGFENPGPFEYEQASRVAALVAPDRDLLLWLHAEAAHKLSLACGSCHPCENWVYEDWRRSEKQPPHPHEWEDAKRKLWALDEELERVGASRQAWAEEAMRQSSELNDYADLLLTCAESPPPEHLARVLRRMTARRPQSCPFVSVNGNGCEEAEGHDGPHLRWFDEIRYEVLATSAVCACPTEGAVFPAGWVRPQCAVHPEAGGE